MPQIEVEVWCSCGNGLCGQSESRGRGIVVEPCEKCLENARSEGHTEGYTEAENDLQEDS